jgi:hypothetical protein
MNTVPVWGLLVPCKIIVALCGTVYPKIIVPLRGLLPLINIEMAAWRPVDEVYLAQVP